MSATRISVKGQPTAIIAEDGTPVAAPKAARKPKVAKVAAVKAGTRGKPAPARLDAKGRKTRCDVRSGTTQCANPARHPNGRHATCSTHRIAIAKGAKVAFVTKIALWVDPAKKAIAS